MAAGAVTVSITSARQYLTTTNKSESSARVIVGFDDGFESVYNKAYPIMELNNQKGIIFVNPGRTTTDYISLDNEKELYNKGWDISNHTFQHTNFKTASNAEIKSSIDDADQILSPNFPKSAKFFAYPYGNYTSYAVNYLREKNFIFARDGSGGYYSNQVNLVTDDLMHIKCRPASNTTTVNQVKEWIGEAVDSNGFVLIYFHKIVDADADTSNDYLTADFQEVSDYLAAWEASGSLVVTTLSEYYKDYLRNDLTMELSGARVSPNDHWLLARGAGNQVYTAHIEEAP